MWSISLSITLYTINLETINILISKLNCTPLIISILFNVVVTSVVELININAHISI